MNSPNVFVLGFLLLTANLSFGALFSPAWKDREGEDRFLRVFQLWMLATVEVAAWALVLYQGGSANDPFEALISSLTWFIQLGWAGAPMSGPLGGLSHFIAVNGLLFIPVTLLPLVRRTPLPLPEEVVLPAAFQREMQAATNSGTVVEQSAPVPKLPPKLPSQRAAETALAARVSGSETHAPGVAEAAPEPRFLETPVNLKPVGAASPPGLAEGAAPVPVVSGAAPAVGAPGAGTGPELQRGGFRPKIPKAIRPDAELSPEEMLAEQMKPVGPTPPPIRFGWKN